MKVKELIQIFEGKPAIPPKPKILGMSMIYDPESGKWKVDYDKMFSELDMRDFFESRCELEAERVRK